MIPEEVSPTAKVVETKAAVVKFPAINAFEITEWAQKGYFTVPEHDQPIPIAIHTSKT